MTLFPGFKGPKRAAAPAAPAPRPAPPKPPVAPALESFATPEVPSEATLDGEAGNGKEKEEKVRYGATPVELPTTLRSPYQIVEKRRSDGVTDYDIFILGNMNFTAPAMTGVADIVHVLEYAAEKATVRILIASDGGSLHAGTRIAAAIRRSPAHVHTVAIGRVASAAALVWSYGKKRTLLPTAYLMFHMSSHGDGGRSSIIAQTASMISAYVRDLALAPLVADGIMTEEEFERCVKSNADIYLSAATVNERMGKAAS